MFGFRRRKKKNKLHEAVKPYVQFSKRIIAFCVFNLVAIEIFVMFMVYITKDTSILPYLITSLAVQFLGCVIWYLKNSEAEKKIRIEAEIERMKLVSNVRNSCEAEGKVLEKVEEALDLNDEPDTFYKGNDDSGNICTDVLPINHNNNTIDNSDNEEEDDSVG